MVRTGSRVIFVDRTDAGRLLGRHLAEGAGDDLAGHDVVVLGLPRGGVPVAAGVAAALGAPLDVIVVRKLGVPFHRELAMGAIGEGEVRVIDPEVVEVAGVSDAAVARVERQEREELARRVARFRGDRPRVDLRGRTALIVDDGIATGSTVRAACEVARAQGAAKVVVAVPVASPDAEARLGGVCDRFVAIDTPASFRGVGQFYDDFTQVPDRDVETILAAER